MGRKQDLSIETRAVIVALHEEGYSTRKIASKTKVSQTAVMNALKRKQQTRSNRSRYRSGRPRVTSQSEDKFICVQSKRQRTRTAPEIREELNSIRQRPVSVTTVQRRLRDYGLKGCVAAKKPLLRKQNKIKRLQWAKKHKDWSIAQWCQVLFSDESKFEIFGGKRRQYVRRQVGERMLNQCVMPTVKHGGGSVMVWGCFAGDKVGDLVQIKGIFDKTRYHHILQRHAFPCGKKIVGRGFVFQQDNDPKHMTNLCKKYIANKERQNELKCMDWPPQSPDLNPIKLIWDELDRNVRKMRPTNQNQLWEFLQACWTQIAATTLNKLIERMPNVCAAVLKSKGGYFEESKINKKI